MSTRAAVAAAAVIAVAGAAAAVALGGDTTSDDLASGTAVTEPFHTNLDPGDPGWVDPSRDGDESE
jgi:hypothetical protein